MTCLTTAIPVNTIFATNSRLDSAMTPPPAPRPRPKPPIASNALERLAQLMISNDRLMDELVTSRARIIAAQAYLDKPGCNNRFGSAHLERSRAKHSAILTQLRANRIEALQLLGQHESDN